MICESIDRVARRAYYGTLIEHRPERAEIPLLAADELIVPAGRGRKGKTATQTLTRHLPGCRRDPHQEADLVICAWRHRRMFGQSKHGVVALLDTLPIGEIKLADLPDELQRAVYNRFRLEVTYDKRIPYVRVQVTPGGEIIDEQRETAIAALAASLDTKTRTSSLS